MCGAATAIPILSRQTTGLSPRVRGSPTLRPLAAIASGSIPTCAGQPASACLRPAGVAVYPHVCGAAMASDMISSFASGLSPRVRGSRYAIDAARTLDRSIPTCAGQPAIDRRLNAYHRVYPHVCGAAHWDVARHQPDSGLSPRVRGSLGERRFRIAESRSIPTCAGQPDRISSCSSAVKVYPHVCGAA